MYYNMKKPIEFILAFFSVVGFIGSLGNLLMLKEYPMCIFLCFLAYASYPKIKEWVKDLLS